MKEDKKKGALFLKFHLRTAPAAELEMILMMRLRKKRSSFI